MSVVINRPAWEESIKGITLEINKRTWMLQAFKDRVVGHEGRFLKPVRNQLPVIEKALVVYREVVKLKAIKNQMQSQL